jgi:iron complex outermembrane recepter protein
MKCFLIRIRGKLLAASLLTFTLVARGQESQPPVGNEAVPRTRVEAAPLVTENFPPAEDTGLTGTILDGTIFSNSPSEGYRAPTSTSASIIAVPDADQPATVSTITEELLTDQATLRLTDAIRNAGAVVPAGDALFADRIFIRGLEVGSRNFRKDGFLDPTFVPRDFQNVERVEILKGPASFLYGSGDPAGIVNVITKKPIANNPFATAGFMFGAYSQARYTADVNSEVTQSGNVIFRLNAAQEDINSFVDFASTNRTQIAPVVTWLMNDSTTLTWNGEWHKDDRIGFQGTPAVNGDPLFLPPSRFVGDPANDFLNTEEFRQSLVLTTELSDEWTFNIGGYSLFYEFPGSTTAALSPLPPAVFGGTAPFARSRQDIPFEDEQSHSMIANLAGEFCLGDMRHRAVIGMEYAYFDSSSQFNFSGIGSVINFPPPTFVPVPFDVANPNYATPTPTSPLLVSDFPVFRQQRVGGYMQDLIDITPKVKAVAGVRFDTLDFTFDRTVNGINARTEEDFNRVTPRGGLVYQPWADESLAFYYNYSQSFTPPGGGIFLFDPPGGIQPILGEGHEAGIKTELLPGLALNVAGYRITRQNDVLNSSSVFLVQVGEVESQGAELNLVGSVTERWNAVANYTYADSRLYDAALGFDGVNTRNVPYNTANFWTRYNVIQDECRTAGAALGLVYLGERPADLVNSLDLPSFARWDAGLYYQRGQFNSVVYLENLFDVQYAQSSINTLQIYQGAPFNVRAAVWYTF